jgi:sugar phosphate isomerase/epimerase
MLNNKIKLPFRLGTTSYIIPQDILPNVRYLAGLVDDVELVLFEVDDGQNNLPTPVVIDTLARLARDSGLSYTVHLPLDLRLGAEGEAQHVSLEKAKKVIERTRPLSPWAYVVHLDGHEARHYTNPEDLLAWQDQAVRALELVAGWAGSLELLAVENLESYPPDFNFPVLERIPVSVCLDIGHLWRDGHDPLVWMQTFLPRARVIHLHGIGERDHQSLALMQPGQVDALFGHLLLKGYAGVLTLEIFSEPDLMTSLRTIKESLERVRANPLGDRAAGDVT